MNKHTPGPWLAKPIGGSISIIEANRPFIIGKVRYSDKRLQQVEDFANARLIAAAPSMYDALLIARDALEAANFPTETKEYIWEAIAKAEGKV